MGNDYFHLLTEKFVELEEGSLEEMVKQGLKERREPQAIIDALVQGLEKIGQSFSAGTAFLPELMASGYLFKKTMEVIKPTLVSTTGKRESKGKILIGTVHGDLHDLGKNLVALMLSVAGFEVIDLGVDVSGERFVEKVKEERPQLVGLSALLTTTMANQEEVIKKLAAANLRSSVKVIVGGAPVDSAWAKKIGADGYAPDAVAAVQLVKKQMAG
jgi:corrinoid protein of di/trimethylamine methyltransferase